MKICKQKEYKWVALSWFPDKYRWKCSICGSIGKLYGKRNSKILPLKEESTVN